MASLRTVFTLLACLCSLAASARVPLTIDNLGDIEGFDRFKSEQFGRTIYSFQGVPFGKTTGGANRFKPSVMVDPWVGQGPLDCTDWGPGCPQLLLPYSTTPAPKTGESKPNIAPEPVSLPEGYVPSLWDKLYALRDPDEETAQKNITRRGPQVIDPNDPEDCLNLHIYSTNLDKAANQAVMVFFHGGAFSDGSARIYLPHFLLDFDVVLVVAHYRLGPLGFLSLGNEDMPGNAAMYDQVLALQWVKLHIHNFGGDPDQVTIFGESAGAASVSLLAVSPLTKGQGLFQRIMAQSGSGTTEWAIDREPRYHTDNVAKLAGCDPDVLDDTALAACLRAVDPFYLTSVYKFGWRLTQQKMGKTGFGGCSPIVETHSGATKFLDKMPIEYWNDPDFTSVPALYGVNKHEGTYTMAIVYTAYLRANGLLEDVDFIKHRSITVFLDLFEIKDPAYLLHDALEYEYVEIDRMGNLTAMIPGMIDFSGAVFLKGPSYQQTRQHAAKSQGNSYFYAFNFLDRTTLWPFVGDLTVPFDGGVSHANDLLFLFPIPGLNLAYTAKERDLAKQMSKLWTNYAIHGEMNPDANRVEGVPDWPAYDPETDMYMRIDEPFQALPYFPTEYTIAKDENFSLE